MRPYGCIPTFYLFNEGVFIMKKAFKVLGIIALVAIVGLSMAACSDDSGGDGGGSNSSVNGTYVNGSEQVKLTNGKDFEVVASGTSIMKGTFTTSGSSITVSISQVWGPAMNDVNTFETRWYTKNELIAEGVSSSMFTMTGTYTASTLTLTWLGETDSYTKSGGGQNPGGGGTPPSGSGGTLTLTGIPSEYSGKYALLYGPTNSSMGLLSINDASAKLSLSRITNGSFSTPVWEDINCEKRYSGNGTGTVSIFIHNTSTCDINGMNGATGRWMSNSSVSFSNGSATLTWSDGKYTAF
jgi:hypothetical protein